MANAQDIKKTKEYCRRRIQQKITEPIQEHPEIPPLSIGLFEFTGNEVQKRGAKCPDIASPSDIKEAIKSLPPEERIQAHERVREYQGEYFKAIEQFNQGDMEGIKNLPEKAVEIASKDVPDKENLPEEEVVKKSTPSLFKRIGRKLLRGFAHVIKPPQHFPKYEYVGKNGIANVLIDIARDALSEKILDITDDSQEKDKEEFRRKVEEADRTRNDSDDDAR